MTLLGLVLLSELLQDFKFLLFLRSLLADHDLSVLLRDLDLSSDLQFEVVVLHHFLLALDDAINTVLKE